LKRRLWRQAQAKIPRDAAPSKLYFGHAKTLASLDADLCTNLALYPHNLFIGAETADADTPSTKLCSENTENSLRNAASLDATNKEAEELLREISEGATGGIQEQKPKAFVAELFDSSAETFDEKLGSLGYKVPGLVVAASKALRDGEEDMFGSALDPGCVCPLVRGAQVGVDASQNLLHPNSQLYRVVVSRRVTAVTMDRHYRCTMHSLRWL
jgi:predicted TPR repeat methyltransferase